MVALQLPVVDHPGMTVRPEVTERAIEKIDGADVRDAVRDKLVVEAPLEIRANGEPLVMVMRTPGHDVELATGLLWAEGVLRSAEEIAAVRRPPDSEVGADERGNIIEVDLSAELIEERWPERSLYSSSACGVCGKTAIDLLVLRSQPVRTDVVVPRSVLSGLPQSLRAAQAVFEQTGGLHAAGFFDASGAVIAVREDVGRHNAVDKLIGHAAAGGGVPVGPVVMCVSGRLSYEIVQKAITAGVPVLAAVSAPSSLAVDLAERFQVTLCGFVRGQRFNIYSHSTRIS